MNANFYFIFHEIKLKSMSDEVFSKSPEIEIPPLIPPLVTPIISKFNTKSSNINTITLDRSLGKGAYGTVYLCRDENGDELAVKCIKSKDFGIPSLIEAAIMSTIHHPYLSKALKIHSTPDKLYIVQELAISDLRVYRQNNSLSMETIVKWTHMIAQAISCLHKNDIIHGDIKASNVLVCSDMKVKLTDFTLTTHINWKNDYRPCTSTHRPLEVWLLSTGPIGQRWNKSIDIWSFGCTIFEMIYGKNLFASQSRDASINAILDWYKYLNQPTNVTYRDVFHYSFNLPDSFVSSNMNDLIISLLTEKRPTINDILKNKLFNHLSVLPSMVISAPITIMLPKTENKIKKQLSTVIHDEITIELAFNLYARIVGMVNSNDKIKMITCAWIAHKMVHRTNISLNYDLHEILQMERLICNYLSYRLWCKTPQTVIKVNL